MQKSKKIFGFDIYPLKNLVMSIWGHFRLEFFRNTSKTSCWPYKKQFNKHVYSPISNKSSNL